MTPTAADQIVALQTAQADADRALLEAVAAPAQALRHAADVYAWAVAAHQLAPLDDSRYDEAQALRGALADAQAAYDKALKTARATRTKTLNDLVK